MLVAGTSLKGEVWEREGWTLQLEPPGGAITNLLCGELGRRWKKEPSVTKWNWERRMGLGRRTGLQCRWGFGL